MEYLQKFLNLPWYAYVGIVVALFIIFGKQKEWEYEAKLFVEGTEKEMGEIELKKFAKEAPTMTLNLEDKFPLNNASLKIELDESLTIELKVSENGQHVKVISPLSEDQAEEIYRPAASIRWNNIMVPFPYLRKPKNNQKVVVNCNGQELTGTFFAD